MVCGKLEVDICRAKNLTKGRLDPPVHAFVTVRSLDQSFRSKVSKGKARCVWNQKASFAVLADSTQGSTRLAIDVIDSPTAELQVTIGRATIDFHKLCQEDSETRELKKWIPLTTRSGVQEHGPVIELCLKFEVDDSVRELIETLRKNKKAKADSPKEKDNLGKEGTDFATRSPPRSPHSHSRAVSVSAEDMARQEMMTSMAIGRASLNSSIGRASINSSISVKLNAEPPEENDMPPSSEFWSMNSILLQTATATIRMDSGPFLRMTSFEMEAAKSDMSMSAASFQHRDRTVDDDQCTTMTGDFHAGYASKRGTQPLPLFQRLFSCFAFLHPQQRKRCVWD